MFETNYKEYIHQILTGLVGLYQWVRIVNKLSSVLQLCLMSVSHKNMQTSLFTQHAIRYFCKYVDKLQFLHFLNKVNIKLDAIFMKLLNWCNFLWWDKFRRACRNYYLKNSNDTSTCEKKLIFFKEISAFEFDICDCSFLLVIPSLNLFMLPSYLLILFE